MRLAWDDFFKDYDLLLCPVAVTAAFPHDHKDPRHERTIVVNNKQVPVVDQIFWAGYSCVTYLPASARRSARRGRPADRRADRRPAIRRLRLHPVRQAAGPGISQVRAAPAYNITALRSPAQDDCSLPFQTAKQLAAAIRKKKIGCLELLDLYLKRVEAHNPALNAIIAIDIEGARKRAEGRRPGGQGRQDARPLHGVPMTIKESFNVMRLFRRPGARPH
jgi:Asp-tRNA(Asn)/Glu-tRNA(Gln) amidotransferase A subunit family amidase